MAKYLFRLEKMHVNAQRNNVDDIPDFDVVTFGVEVGDRQYGPLKAYGWWQLHSGFDLDFAHFTKDQGFRHDANRVQRGRWEIGPIDVADDDVATVDYAIVNAYDAISRGTGGSSELTRQIGVASWAALVGLGGAFAGPPGAVITAIAAGLATVVGFIVKGPRICDGVVGGNKRFFTGAELRKATNNPQQTFLTTDTSGNSDPASGCGTSQIVMTFSATFVPYYSIKEFLLAKSALALPLNWPAGFRSYTKSVLPSFYSGASTSVRSVIEQWESFIIA